MASPNNNATLTHNPQQPAQETSPLFTINKSESQPAMSDLQQVRIAISSNNPGGSTIASVMITPNGQGLLTDSFPIYVPNSNLEQARENQICPLTNHTDAPILASLPTTSLSQQSLFRVYMKLSRFPHYKAFPLFCLTLSLSQNKWWWRWLLSLAIASSV